MDTNQEPRRALKRTDSRIAVGLLLVVVGAVLGIPSYMMGIVPMLALGLASSLIGIMVLYLPGSASVSTSVLTDSALPSLLNIEKLLQDLDLDERGIYIPVAGPGIAPRVFVPLAVTPSTKRPPLGLAHSRRIFVTVGKNPEDRGILLDAPGSGILSDLERSLHLDFARVPLSDLGSELDSGFRALGIAKLTSLVHQDASVRIEMELTKLFDLEAKLMSLTPRLSEHVGTPIVSTLAAATSKATAKYVKIGSAVFDLPRKKVNVTLQILA